MALVEASLIPPERETWLQVERRLERTQAARDLAARLRARRALAPVSPPKRDWLIIPSSPIYNEHKLVHPARITIAMVMCRVSARTGYSRESLISPCRKRDLAFARQEVMYLARILTGRSYPQLGRYLGDRDHTSIIHGVKAHAVRYGLPPAESVTREHAIRMMFSGPEAPAE